MLVSVIIPTYNRADLLIKAINSVLNQTVTDVEIIVVDDGSTDQTKEAVKAFENKVKFLRQDHNGPNAARNFALMEAKGEYIALLDDDDLWLDFKLELQISLMRKFPELSFIFSDFFIFKESGERISSGLKTWYTKPKAWHDIFEKKIKYSTLDISKIEEVKDFNIFIGELYYDLLFEPYVLPSSALVRKSCIGPDIQFVNDDFHCGDWDFFAQLSRKYPAGFMELETTINRSHDDEVRLTRKSEKKQTECRLGLIERVWKTDKKFYEKHKTEVNEVEENQLVKLIKYQLLDSDNQGAKNSLRKLDKLVFRKRAYMIFLLRLLAYFPGGSKILISIRYLRRFVLTIRDTIGIKI